MDGDVQLELAAIKKQMKVMEAAIARAGKDESVHLAPYVKGVENKRATSD